MSVYRIVFILLFSFSAAAQKSLQHHIFFPSDTLTAHPEWPAIRPDDEIVRHFAYTLSYDDPHEQAKWVAYQLTAGHTSKNFARKNNFKADPLVTSVSATSGDYAKSGYDRGHLAPANDMSWSQTAMSESFFYSNMSPQLPAFNRGVWKKLEALVHGWASLYGNIMVVTGPVFSPYYDCAGQVAVPIAYYKVVMKTAPPYESIGFIIPNAGSALPIENFAQSVSEVEKRTGIDFFPAVKDKSALSSEKILCKSCWTWKSAKSSKR